MTRFALAKDSFFLSDRKFINREKCYVHQKEIML